jgi:DDE family transposase
MHSSQGRFSQQMKLLRRQFAQSAELPFSDVLSLELVQRVLAEAGVAWKECIYTPLTTLLVFLWQVISQDQCCQGAVTKLAAHRVANGQRACSTKTGGYCTARKRLPKEVFSAVARATGQRLNEQTPRAWRWHDRHVKLFDGSTVSMPDTPANQAAYPQPNSQAEGVGFPLARIAAVFSLACGAVLDLAICRYQGKGQSELGLLRQLWDLFATRDVMLADRYLCSWFELAVLQSRGADFVSRLHQGRRADFRRGQRLGPNDHVVAWPKPRRPDWMDQATYDALPAELSVREVRLDVRIEGFRPRQIVVVTSLVDAEEFSAAELAGLYRQRWHAEVDLKSLKDTMQMDVLRCLTPELVCKEIWTHVLAYNLVRTVMAQAAIRGNVLPRQLSFKAALHAILAFQPHLEHASPPKLTRLYHDLLDAILPHAVANRPNRYEPRARKRRPKTYPLLMVPRTQARAAMRHNEL